MTTKQIKTWFRRFVKSQKRQLKYGGVKYWIKSLLFDNYIGYKLKNIIWFIKYRTTHKYHIVKTGLKPNYYDMDTRMLHVNFNLLKEFVEKSHYNEIVDYDTNDDDRKTFQEINFLYKWWTQDRNNREKNLRLLEEEHYKKFPANLSFVPHDLDEDGDPISFLLLENPKKSEEEQKIYKDSLFKITDMETNNYIEDTEMLIRLMKIRSHLWV
jgi:hypothetical protein